MWHRIIRWLAPLLVVGFSCLPAAHAQSTKSFDEGGGVGNSPALPYTFAFVFTLLALVIVCTPSRKAVRE